MNKVQKKLSQYTIVITYFNSNECPAVCGILKGVRRNGVDK